MSHPTLTSDLARAHQSELRRGAARRRLSALVRCCRPSRLRAALRSRRVADRDLAVVGCC